MTDAVEIDTNAILDAVARLDYARAPMEGRKIFIRDTEDLPQWVKDLTCIEDNSCRAPRMIAGCIIYLDASLNPGQFKVIG
jgi:hypothetical protein